MFFQAMRYLGSDPTKNASAVDIATTVANVRKLSRIAEHEINEAVLSCTRARRQMMELMPVSKPTVH